MQQVLHLVCYVVAIYPRKEGRAAAVAAILIINGFAATLTVHGG